MINVKRIYFGISVIILFTAIIKVDAQNLPGAKVTPGDINHLLNISRNSLCNEIENRVFLIDKKLLLWVRKGKCRDNSYSYILYGRGLKKLCYEQDSIAGTIFKGDSRYERLFKKLVKNISKENLGQDKRLQVEEITEIKSRQK
jgi:hypothetical protein